MGTNNNIEIQYGSWKESVVYITSILMVFKNLHTISKQLRLQQNQMESSEVLEGFPDVQELLGWV